MSELVPREEIPAAAELSSISVNIARAIGPAIAGILIAHLGVGAIFALNAGTFLIYGVVVALWRASPDTTSQIPERFVSALRAGGRYVRHAPVVRRILFRAALFLVPASALWALLLLVASRRLGLGPSGYGLLLGALGLGAIAGASVLSMVRARLSTNALIGLVGGVFAAVLVAAILLRSTIAVVIVLIPAGMAWVGMLATVNTLLQLFLPPWVRAHGLSVYQMVLFGAQGLGAVAWGLVATEEARPCTSFERASILGASWYEPPADTAAFAMVGGKITSTPQPLQDRSSERVDTRPTREFGRLRVSVHALTLQRAAHDLLLSASPSIVGGNRGLWALRVPFEHLDARVYPDMFSLAQAHRASTTPAALHPPRAVEAATLCA